jgi:hypothetical protein
MFVLKFYVEFTFQRISEYMSANGPVVMLLQVTVCLVFPYHEGDNNNNKSSMYGIIHLGTCQDRSIAVRRVTAVPYRLSMSFR